MKHMPVEYYGSTSMDRRCAGPMLPWIISEIKRKNQPQKVNLLVASGLVTAYVDSAEQPVLQHPLRSSLKPQLAPANCQDPRAGSFLYMIRGDEGRYYYHLFRAKDAEAVQELFAAMKEQQQSSASSSSSATGTGTSGTDKQQQQQLLQPDKDRDGKDPVVLRDKDKEREVSKDQFGGAGGGPHQRSMSSAAALTTIGADISPSSSHFFEVLYVGRTKIANPKVSETFIDDVLVKFRTHVLEKSKSNASTLLADCQQLRQQANVAYLFGSSRRDSMDSNNSDLQGSVESVGSGQVATNLMTPVMTPTSPMGGSVESFPGPPVLENPTNVGQVPKKTLSMPMPDVAMRNRAASTGSVMLPRRDSVAAAAKDDDTLNRTMLFQVGRTDLRLISPGGKKVLLHKHLRDVASCVQGIENPEHFGFIARDGAMDRFIGYIFKCQSESVADDLVAAITQAFVASCDIPRRERPHSVFSCDHCPMVWYSKLCQEIEGQNDRKTQSIIFQRMELLPEDEQEIVVTKFKGAEAANGADSGRSLREQNEFLLALLRAHCESKQTRHVHDTAENRSEFLNQYLSVGVGSTIFMKAKRSLTNSFDHLMKRKGSKDDFGLNNNHLFKNGLQSPMSPTPNIDVEANRPKSLRVSPEQQLNFNAVAASPKSPMMDIFLKVGNSPKMSPPETDGGSNRLHPSGSWRQAILNRVVTPGKDQGNKSTDKGDTSTDGKTLAVPRAKRSKEELRELWKKAINQQVILIRMEKENARLKVRQKEANVKRIKLEYDELSSCARELVEVWDLLVSKESRISTKCDNQMLLQAIKQGVPRGKRGEVWQFLAEQFCLKQPPIETKDFPNYNTPYDLLLKQLTSQQHAILIDLGRTFPNHPYFSSSLGPGQLALFNLLKAYSLLDHEVGYCQGLSFVAGVLLLHMAEDQAFFLLRHLMFRRGLRKLYLPDMAALQLHLYQLSRLLHDRLPDIYNHFDKHEVSPTLYAAPWLLTLFASQFPLGFVTRVFDLLFLESSEVIFRVALALLEEHQDNLLHCDSFEEIMDYLKVKVPAVDKNILDRVMKRVFYPDMEMAKQLNEYRVEYQVLQEEMISVKPQIENMERLEELNRQLTRQNSQLTEQLEIALANLHRLETTRNLHLTSVHRLESQNRSLEVTVATLGSFIQQLVDSRADIEIPGDVRRIVAQLSVAEKRRGITTNSNSIVKSSYPAKITEDPDDNRFDSLRKTNSAGGQRLIKSQSVMAPPYPLKSALSQPNLGAKLERVSSFFAQSHNQIKQQQAHINAIRGGDDNNEKIDQSSSPTSSGSPARTLIESNTTITPNHDENDSKTVNSTIENNTVPDSVPHNDVNSIQLNHDNNNSKSSVSDSTVTTQQNILEKPISLPIQNPKSKLKSTKSAYELGSIKKVPTTKLEEIQDDSLTGVIHPLDTCSDVNFKYGGTTKLKSIKPCTKGSPITTQNGQSDDNSSSLLQLQNNKDVPNNPQILSTR